MVKALTVRTIETIKPGATRQEIPDGFVRGLYYVIQPSGARSWALRYRSRQRESRKLTIGSYPGIGLKDARELASRALVAVASGADPAFDKQAAKVGAKPRDDLDLVEKVVERFLERYVRPNVRPSSAREYERVLRKEVVERWKGRRLSELGRADIHEMLDQVVDRGSPVQANRVLAAVRKLCSWSIERGLIEASPCAGIKPPTSETSRVRVLSNDELLRISRSCDSLGYPFGPMVKLLLLTGQRRNEVADMTWAEIHLDGKTWTIPRTRAKNGNEHAVPLSSQVIAIIEGLPRIGDRYLFTTTGKSPVSGFSKAKTILDKQIGSPALPHWTFHDLRRTAATGMARLGIALPVIEKVLNHTSGSFGGIVGVYQKHGFADEKRHALEAWGSFVERLVSGETGGERGGAEGGGVVNRHDHHFRRLPATIRVNAAQKIGFARAALIQHRGNGFGPEDDDAIARQFDLSGMDEFWDVVLSEPMECDDFSHALAVHFMVIEHKPNGTETDKLASGPAASRVVDAVKVQLRAALWQARVDGEPWFIDLPSQKKPINPAPTYREVLIYSAVIGPPKKDYALVVPPSPPADGVDLSKLKVRPREAAEWLVAMPKRRHLVPPSLMAAMTQQVEIKAFKIASSTSQPRDVGLPAGSSVSEIEPPQIKPSTSQPKRQRGPKPLVGPRVKAEMRDAIQQGVDIGKMTQFEMSLRFKAAESMCRDIRKEILSENCDDPNSA